MTALAQNIKRMVKLLEKMKGDQREAVKEGIEILIAFLIYNEGVRYSILFLTVFFIIGMIILVTIEVKK